MGTSVIYYSHALTPGVEKLSELLLSADFNCRWQPIDSLEECPVGAFVLLGEHDLNLSEQPLLASRRVLLLADSWSFEVSVHWVGQGAIDCLCLDDIERIAAWLHAQRAQLESSREAFLETDVLQAVIDAIPAPIFFKDEQHIYRGCNAAFGQFIGISPEKVIGSSVYDVAPKPLADRYYQADTELLASGGTQRYEAPVRYADGTQRDIEFYKAVFYKPDGRLGGQVGVMLDVTERNRLIRKLEKSSRTDHLTGTGNRREFEAVAFRELRRHRKERGALCLLCIDIDHFKRINDNYGHAVGDQALLFMVECCRSRLRKDDSLFRVGGEEFYIVLPNTDLGQAYQAAERLCEYLRGQTLRVNGIELRMTVSIGVVELTGSDSLDHSLELADQALYRAKGDGRDRVCLASHELDAQN
ncbi:MAG: diguanylate cyclase [Oceanospirillales bacterium]|nr:diguanylate cyclase [Oceanospirillales bacterium]